MKTYELRRTGLDDCRWNKENRSVLSAKPKKGAIIRKIVAVVRHEKYEVNVTDGVQLEIAMTGMTAA